MFFALSSLIRSGEIPRGEHVVAIHTGGLQGLRGMQRKLDNLLLNAG